MPPSDRTIEEWASERHGIVTLAELETLGLGGRGVRHRVSSGRLHRVHRGVYSVERPRRRGLWMAAVCAAGPGAVLSHRSAAALSGLIVDPRPPISVTVPHAANLRQRKGMAIHCSTSLAPEDLIEVDGIPCTGYARTLLDLASEVDGRTLIRAIERAESLRQFDLDAIVRVVARNRGRRGTRKLVAALDGWTEPAIARSAAEERFIDLVERAGIPTPEVNAWVPLERGNGYRPDFLWRDQGLIAEVDGRAYHARRRAFAHDRRRDRLLAVAGFRTIRYAASEVMARPDAVAAEIERLLAHGA